MGYVQLINFSLFLGCAHLRAASRARTISSVLLSVNIAVVFRLLNRQMSGSYQEAIRQLSGGRQADVG